MQGCYLLLGSKNDIHEVHILESTVLSSFYHLFRELQTYCQTGEKNWSIMAQQE